MRPDRSDPQPAPSLPCATSLQSAEGCLRTSRACLTCLSGRHLRGACRYRGNGVKAGSRRPNVLPPESAGAGPGGGVRRRARRPTPEPQPSRHASPRLLEGESEPAPSRGTAISHAEELTSVALVGAWRWRGWVRLEDRSPAAKRACGALTAGGAGEKVEAGNGRSRVCVAVRSTLLRLSRCVWTDFPRLRLPMDVHRQLQGRGDGCTGTGGACRL